VGSAPHSYRASDGSLWHLVNDCPPIPTRAHDWSATHDDYDGAPDAHDDRHVTAPTITAVMDAVEELVREHSEESSASEKSENPPKV